MSEDFKDNSADRHPNKEPASQEKEAQEPLAPSVQAVAETQNARMAQAEAVAQQKEATEAAEAAQKAPSTDTPKDAFDDSLQSLKDEFEVEEDDPKQLFYAVAQRLAQEVQETYGVPWQVTLAQACLESGYGVGMNEAGRRGFVVFGIKPGKGYEGETVGSKTKEAKDGKLEDTKSQFRAYDSIRAAFMDYGRVLARDFSYALEAKEDPTAFLVALQSKPGHQYATDPEYVHKIQNFWASKDISVAPTTTEDEPFWRTAVNYLSDLAGDLKKAIAGFLESLGVDTKKWGFETKGEMEEPNAPFFSFENGVETYVTSAFGERHDPFNHSKMADHAHGGVDISAPLGAKIHATFSGKVTRSAGSTLVVQREDGVSVTMLHLSSRSVKKGDTVKTGMLLGAVGNEGHSTGPHLHFETRKDGKLVDPMPYLSARLQGQYKEVAARQAEQVAEIRANS